MAALRGWFCLFFDQASRRRHFFAEVEKIFRFVNDLEALQEFKILLLKRLPGVMLFLPLNIMNRGA